MNERPPTVRRIDFLGGVWHGAFLAVGMAFANLHVVIPAFVAELTGSSLWVGGLAALLAVSATAPQIVVARYVEPMHKKRPVLLAAIYLRAGSWAALGLLIIMIGPNHPDALLWCLVGLLGLFSMGGALGGVPLTDIVGKIIPRRHRGSFFASRQAAGSVLSVGASAVAGLVLVSSYPTNYGALFLLSALALSVASLGIWCVREPVTDREESRRMAWGPYLRSLAKPLRDLRGLASVTWATGVGLMAVPFYIVAARQSLGAPPQATALFIGAMVVGALVGNLAWGRLVDRYSSRRMLLACVVVSAATPALALLAWVAGWQVLVLVTGLFGATVAGRVVGFSSALLELAPAHRRATYTATYAFVSLPVAVMPLIGGVISTAFSFRVLFALTAILLLGAVVVVQRWDRRDGSR